MKRTPMTTWLLSSRTSTFTLDHLRFHPPRPTLMTHHHPELSHTLLATTPHKRLGYREAAQALQLRQHTFRQRWQALGHPVPAPASHSTRTIWPRTPTATRYSSRSVSRTTTMTYEDDMRTLSSMLLHDYRAAMPPNYVACTIDKVQNKNLA